jgi:hypothetical protein
MANPIKTLRWLILFFLRQAWEEKGAIILLSFVIPLASVVLETNTNHEFIPESAVIGPILVITGIGLVLLPGIIQRMKSRSHLDWLSSLPITRGFIVSALLLSYAIVLLPGFLMIITYIIVVWHISISQALALIIPSLIIWPTVAVIGIFIGLSIKSGLLAGTIGLVISLVLLFPILPWIQVPSQEVSSIFSWLPPGIAAHLSMEFLHFSGNGTFVIPSLLGLIYATGSIFAIYQFLPWHSQTTVSNKISTAKPI